MQTKKITISGLLITIGVLLPIIFHHIPGNLGPVMLPIHYSAFIAGGLLGPIAGMIVGSLTPVISHLLTGMPVSPVFIYISFETFTYGLLFGCLYQKLKYNIYFSLVTAMIFGRLANILGNFIIADIIFSSSAMPFKIINSLNNFTVGLIGAFIQIIIIPIIIYRVRQTISLEGLGGQNV